MPDPALPVLTAVIALKACMETEHLSGSQRRCTVESGALARAVMEIKRGCLCSGSARALAGTTAVAVGRQKAPRLRRRRKSFVRLASCSRAAGGRSP